MSMVYPPMPTEPPYVCTPLNSPTPFGLKIASTGSWTARKRLSAARKRELASRRAPRILRYAHMESCPTPQIVRR